MRVIDFFCGAGGFSEGFRQQGFDIVMGVDNWRPAVETHNLNHGLHDEPTDILLFERETDAIDALPDTEVIVGSPPCVSFSMSNRAGKADKSLGIRLIEAYLKVVAVKKHQPGSILKAWYMENVPNSKNFVKPEYTFRDLGLKKWALENGKEPEGLALRVRDNGAVLCAADYGSPQKRERFVCGEAVKTGDFLAPKKTHPEEAYVTLVAIKGKMPPPDMESNGKRWTDPNYPGLELKTEEITDQFYDTGVYEIDWTKAKHMKVNHPFMGRMSFPEDENRPSRTIMATRSASTREALLYPSEYARKGDGAYRLPSIREAASLMGFPYLYQFTGGEGSKWRQIGNAVCPHMSAALAKAIRQACGLDPIPQSRISFANLRGAEGFKESLNTFTETTFDSPPVRKEGARFRRHLFKEGNMTVNLMNYDPLSDDEEKRVGQWRAAVYVGAGKRYDILPLSGNRLEKIDRVAKGLPEYQDFISGLKEKIAAKLGAPNDLQMMYETNRAMGDLLDPISLIDRLTDYIRGFDRKMEFLHVDQSVIGKRNVPKRQLLAMLALGRLCEMTERTRARAA